jgi:micrococcal nuclease
MWFCLTLGLWCTISGPATVHDGDTIRVAGHAIRLAGIDAEELNEPHGDMARRVMEAIVGTDNVTCHVTGKSYKRYVAQCFIAGDVDVGEMIVRAGAALDCAHYSGGRYRKFEPSGARARLIQKPYC